MKEIVLFGAGRRAPFIISKVRFFCLEIAFLVDNDIKRQDQFLEKLEIRPPSVLSDQYYIIITCKDSYGIVEQIEEMGLGANIVTEEELPFLYYERAREQGELIPERFYSEPAVIFDLISRERDFNKWGGTEIWCYNMAKKLREHRREAVLFMNQENVNEETGVLSTELFDSRSFTIKDVAERLVMHLPCIVVDNLSKYLLYGAIVVKKLYPGQVFIVSMLHMDLDWVYENSVRYDEYIDKYMCVSLKIRDRLIRMYDIRPEKTCFKESMIPYDASYDKNYHTDLSAPLAIGYACRLVKNQKRTHLLPQVIQKLQENSVNYVMEIAGDGECYADIQRFIAENRLEMKVKLLGCLNQEEMKQYWKKQDIYLNISSYEGTSLAMLEAMSYGCVPVVTDVSGVDEFIEHHINGCVVDVLRPLDVADEIIRLEKDRELLRHYGRMCRKIVREKCDPDAYLAYMERVMGLEGGASW